MLKSFLTFFWLSSYPLTIFTPLLAFMIVSSNTKSSVTNSKSLPNRTAKWTISKSNAAAIGCILILFCACVRKTHSSDVREDLKSAWLTYLKRQPNIDSNKVKFEIKDIYFFADTAAYICQFKVRVQNPTTRFDTTGMMGGTISKDFSVVHRRY